MRTHLSLVAGAATAAVLSVGLLSPAAHAHVSVESTSPKGGAVITKAPKSVSVTLSGPIRSGTLRVVNAKGTTVSVGSGGRDPRNVDRVGVDLKSGLRPGKYTASAAWVAADGHDQTYSFSFRLKKRT